MRVDREGFAEWNEAMVQKYDIERYYEHPSPIVRFIEGRRVGAVLKLLATRPDDAILEVGCGAGHVLVQVPPCKLTGLDLSESLLAKARQRVGEGAEMILGDAENLPFADGTFDKVYCTEVIEHVLEPEKVLTEIKRVLKPNGYAIVSIPNEHLINSLKDVLLKFGIFRKLLHQDHYNMSEKMDDEWHLHSFDLALLKQKATGIFKVGLIEAVPFGLLPIRYVVRLDKE